MKVFKIVGILLVVLVAAFFVASFTLSPTIRLSEQVKVYKDGRTVFNKVNLVKDWQQWDPWLEDDPGQKRKHSLAKKGEGAWVEWTNSKNGDGRMTFERAKPFTHILAKIESENLDKPMEFSFNFTEVDDEDQPYTTVKWRVKFEAPPMMRVMAHLTKSSFQKDIKQGLLNIKSICESDNVADPDPAAIKVESRNEMQIFYILDSAHMKNGLYGRMDSLYTQIRTFADENEVTIVGPPMAFWYSYNINGVCIFEAAYPVSAIVSDTTGRVQAGLVPEGLTIKAAHMGNLFKSNWTYNKIEDYMETYGYTLVAPPWEVYQNGPFNEPEDTASWHTDIFYPVQ